MFKNLNTKIITGTIATAIAVSSVVAIPTFAFAKENHGKGKNNFGKAVSAWAHFKQDDNHDNLGFGIGKLISIDAFSTVSQDSVKIFKQEMKDAKTTKKEAYKEAKTTLKTSLQTADTPEEKKSAAKTFLSSILSAFQAFAAAKEAALTKFIASF